MLQKCLYGVLGHYVVNYMISKNEHGMVELRNCSGEIIGEITANQMETLFFFYEFDGKNYKKLGKAESPLDLEKRFNLKERMGLK